MVREWERDLLSLTFRYSSLILTTHHSLSLSLVVFFHFLNRAQSRAEDLNWQSPTCGQAQRGTPPPPPPCLRTKPALSFFVSSHWLDRACRRHGSQEPWRRGLRSVLSGPLEWKKMENIFIIFQLIYYQESLRPDRCKLQGSEPCQSWCSEEPISTNLCSSHTVWSSQHVHTS